MSQEGTMNIHRLLSLTTYWWCGKNIRNNYGVADFDESTQPTVQETIQNDYQGYHPVSPQLFSVSFHQLFSDLFYHFWFPIYEPFFFIRKVTVFNFNPHLTCPSSILYSLWYIIGCPWTPWTHYVSQDRPWSPDSFHLWNYCYVLPVSLFFTLSIE